MHPERPFCRHLPLLSHTLLPKRTEGARQGTQHLTTPPLPRHLKPVAALPGRCHDMKRSCDGPLVEPGSPDTQLGGTQVTRHGRIGNRRPFAKAGCISFIYSWVHLFFIPLSLRGHLPCSKPALGTWRGLRQVVPNLKVLTAMVDIAGAQRADRRGEPRKSAGEMQTGLRGTVMAPSVHTPRHAQMLRPLPTHRPLHSPA